MTDKNAEDAIREAMAAAKLSLKILQENGDQPGCIKAARAMGDLAARWSRLDLGDGFEAPPNKHLEDVYTELIRLMEDPDPKRRDQAVSSLRSALQKKEL